MDEHRVVPSEFLAHLADRLEKGERLDVAYGASHLHDHHVHVIRDPANGVLDFARDVWDHLHGLAQVVAAALLGDDALIDAPRRAVVGAHHAGVREALVVPEVEIGLGAVIGNEDFAVLERTHGARVDVQVRIELQKRDLQPARLEQAADRGGSQPLSERADHTSGYEDIFGTHTPPGNKEPVWQVRCNELRCTPSKSSAGGQLLPSPGAPRDCSYRIQRSRKVSVRVIMRPGSRGCQLGICSPVFARKHPSG